ARRLKGRDESEDLTHDLLIKISSRLDFEKLDNPEGYLFSAAANLLRDRKRHEKIACKHFIRDGPATEYTEGISPERILISKQSLRRIMAALNRLDRRARNVFILHRIEGMKYADIAR